MRFNGIGFGFIFKSERCKGDLSGGVFFRQGRSFSLVYLFPNFGRNYIMNLTNMI